MLTRPSTPTHPQVSGEEEVPEGAVALITPDAPDVLSHVSVRARNMRVLFATCYNPDTMAQLKVRLRVCVCVCVCVHLLVCV